MHTQIALSLNSVAISRNFEAHSGGFFFKPLKNRNQYFLIKSINNNIECV
jgi:hypothetical protein